MITNHRYLAHKLDTTPEVGVANPLQLSPTTCAYTTSAVGSEVDVYEIMRRSESVKNTVPTTDNVCYSSIGH